MKCRKAKELLALMVFDELDDQRERRRLEGHLAKCDQCSQLLQDMQSATNLLREGLQAEGAQALDDTRHAAIAEAAAEAQSAGAHAPSGKIGATPKTADSSKFRVVMAVATPAAAVLLGLLIIGGLLLPATQKAREKARRISGLAAQREAAQQRELAELDALSFEEGGEASNAYPADEEWREGHPPPSPEPDVGPGGEAEATAYQRPESALAPLQTEVADESAAKEVRRYGGRRADAPEEVYRNLPEYDEETVDETVGGDILTDTLDGRKKRDMTMAAAKDRSELSKRAEELKQQTTAELSEDLGDKGGWVDAEVPEQPVFKSLPVNPFVLTANDRFSTFGLDTDTASYTIARNYLVRGSLPPPAAIRMEEFVNKFDYNYPRQSRDVFDVHVQGGASPFGRGLVLLKIGVQGKVLGREGRKPAHLVFVIDASGSMAREDRLPLVKYALLQLLDQLGPRDRVSVVSYGSEARLVADRVPVSESDTIREAISAIQCSGSTNLMEGLRLGYQKAAAAFQAGEINRVILCSDGVANLGETEAEALLQQVGEYRDQGITFTSVGFGMGTYNDQTLEELANRGDGTYVFVDTAEEARRIFRDEMAATLQYIAKDAKIQVGFNPERVRRYRLIGYENRDIADEDFRDDTVDAGEVGSGKSATALYELELLAPEPARQAYIAPADLGTVYVRYRDTDTGRVEEISQRIRSESVRERTPANSPRFFLAACAAEFAEILRHSEHARNGSLEAVQYQLEQVAVELPLDDQVRQLLQLVKCARRLQSDR